MWRVVGGAIAALLLAACSSVSSPPTTRSTVPAPIGASLSAIERFFSTHGVPLTKWSRAGNEQGGTLKGMESYIGGAGPLDVEVVGNPSDESQLGIDYIVSNPADNANAKALVLATVQHYASGAAAWIRGAVDSLDGSNGFFAGSSVNDTSGNILLSFSTTNAKLKTILLKLGGFKTT
jgi:hypothetical protein